MTKPTPEQQAELLANMLEKFRGRIATIEARSVPHMNYVLAWTDARYVGFPTSNTDPQVVGFERAAFFGDHEAASVWLRKGLTDGRGEAPQIVSAFNAKQTAILEIQKAIDTIEASKKE